MKKLTLLLLFLTGVLTTLKAQETHIIFIGNSITQGVILKEPLTASPPAQTMAWLAAQDDRPFGFSNCGVSGRTTVNFLPAKAAEYNNVVAAADAAQAKGARLLFSVMLGTNDSAVRGPLGAPVLPEQYHTNMKAIADALLQRYPGAMIVLHRPIWYSPSTHNSSVYLPDRDKATGRMVIALPGGGYSGLAMFHEGFDWAEWFLSKGIAFGVLKYRMPAGDHTIPFSDVQAAFTLAKEHAAEWNVHTGDIGIMGSSAGGHLASTYATHAKAGDKPAFQILLYPVITMDASFTHAGSRMNLLGENPSQELTDRFSNEKRVDASTPPAFIIFAADDKVVPPANGFRYAEALTRHGVPVTFLLYLTGGHGFGNRESFSYKAQFMEELTQWLARTAVLSR